MPPTLEIRNTDKTIEITGASPLASGNDRVGEFVDAIEELHEAVPLSKFLLEDQGGGVFLYKINAADGRIWKQRLRSLFSGTEMDFTVNDYWKITEFAPHRRVRDLVVDLVVNYNVTKIEVTWD